MLFINPLHRRLARLATLLIAPAITTSLVHAAWPDDQAIRIIVPQAAGGTNDIVARLVGNELAKSLKQSVVIENRPGAAGAIAAVQRDIDALAVGGIGDGFAELGVDKAGHPVFKIKGDLVAHGTPR